MLKVFDENAFYFLSREYTSCELCHFFIPRFLPRSFIRIFYHNSTIYYGD